jgi:hypothetical protein
MINVIPLGLGATIGADAIIELVKRNKPQLIAIAKITDGEYCSLLAVFKKDSLGELVAFVNEWGTGRGMWFDSWEQISRVEKEINTEGIQLTEYDLSSEGWSTFKDVIGENAKPVRSAYERMLAWENIALDICSNRLPNLIVSGIWYDKQ